PLFFSFSLGAEGSKREREGVFKGHRPLDPLKLMPMGVSPIGINLRATPFPKGCRVLPAGVWGVPTHSSFFSQAAVGGARGGPEELRHVPQAHSRGFNRISTTAAGCRLL